MSSTALSATTDSSLSTTSPLLLPLSSFLTFPFPLRLLLVRHGQSVSNTRPDLIAGRADEVPLTPLGTLQCKALAARLHSTSYHPHLVLSSTAVRAIATTSALVPASHPVVTSPHLLEQSQGEWTGQPRARVYTSEVHDEMRRLHVDFAAPGGESIRQAGERALRVIWKEVAGYREGEEGGKDNRRDALNVLVVSHGMVIRALVFLLCGLRGEGVWRLGCDNCSLTELVVDSRGVALIRLNDHSHTDGLTSQIHDR